MAENKTQFQKGLSLSVFLRRFGASARRSRHRSPQFVLGRPSAIARLVPAIYRAVTSSRTTLKSNIDLYRVAAGSRQENAVGTYRP